MRCAFGEEDEQEVDVELDLEILKETQIFKYLGSMIQSDGGMEEEIKHRVQSAWMNWKKRAGLMLDKRICTKLKKKVYTGVIRPAFIFGAETWATTKREEERLNVNEMRMLRWTCGVRRRDRVANRHVRGSLHVTEVAAKVKERRLAWFGHVERREVEHYLRRALARQVPGRRNLRWIDCVNRDMREAVLTRDMALNRNQWKTSLRNHFSDPV